MKLKRSAVRKVLRIGLLSLALLGMAIGLPVTYRRASGNLGTIEAGQIFRSAQLSPNHLGQLVRDRGIKTVLNLRGPNPDQSWYRGEVAAVTEAGATLIDVPLSSDQWISREQARTLLEVLDQSERPLLFHCEFGAERTGLVSAFAELLRPGRTLEDARSQFSIRYLFLPTKDGSMMLGHLDRYEDWLRETGQGHNPDHFRRWLGSVYRPGSPSREFWPCNPYPRKVVTTVRPDGSLQTIPETPENACPKMVATQIEEQEASRK